MFKKIKVIGVFFVWSIVGVTLNALDLPIQQKYDITIENGAFTVFEFPFTVKKPLTSGFLIDANSTEIKEMNKRNTKVIVDPRTKRQVTKKAKIIQIKQGKKTLTFLPKARGEFQLIVWGYKKFPLMFNIKVMDSLQKKDSGFESHYNFLDYSENEKLAKKFEFDPHEKVIVKLIRSIYNKKLPPGYKSTRDARKFSDDIFDYTLNFSFIGKKYVVDEWLLKNKTNQEIKLYEELFLKDGVYAVSFENDISSPHLITRMFLVRKRFNKNKGI